MPKVVAKVQKESVKLPSKRERKQDLKFGEYLEEDIEMSSSGEEFYSKKRTSALPTTNTTNSSVQRAPQNKVLNAKMDSVLNNVKTKNPALLKMLAKLAKK